VEHPGRPRVLLIDNYDSFTYNLLHVMESLGGDVIVRRNDEASVKALKALKPTHLVISPGPGTPEGAGVSIDVILELGRDHPTLGVCLGHQCVAVAFGGKVLATEDLCHGKTTPIEHDATGLFTGLPSPFPAARYHSLAVLEASLPSFLQVNAWTGGIGGPVVMGIQHRTARIAGVQFHPESYLTTSGPEILRNFLRW
jgi:anthranilate synthase component 2